MVQRGVFVNRSAVVASLTEATAGQPAVRGGAEAASSDRSDVVSAVQLSQIFSRNGYPS